MLTDAQKATLKAAILAETDSTLVEERDAGGMGEVAEWYSGVASPTFTVWKSTVTSREVMNSVTFSGAGGFIQRTQGERDAFMMLIANGGIEPWRSNIRQAFSDIFSGSGTGAPETRAALLALSKRPALRIEKVFATGTGSDASPATLVWEGGIDGTDISAALAS